MILLADPDREVASPVLDLARSQGLRAEWCRDGGEALVLAGVTQPDVLVVAAELPTVDSSSVIRILKNRWPMCILVGAGPEDCLRTHEALAAGAIAAVARPYELGPILALGLGTSPWSAARVGPNLVLVAGPITIDLQRHEARLDGVELRFTHRELQLLIYLIRRAGRVADQTEISTAVWGRPVDTNTVAVHIKRLRDKLGDHPRHGRMIRTVRGAGYRLAPSLCTQARSTAS